MDIVALDPLPLYRLGLLAALGEGREFASHEELAVWQDATHEVLILMTLSTAELGDSAWDVLASLQQQPKSHAVALLAPFTIASAARALRAGAVHVAPREIDAEGLRNLVDEVRRGVVRLPLEVVRSATALNRQAATHRQISDQEVGWLRDLGSGATVEHVADQSNLSTRMLYRNLRRLYRQLGVANRTQALLLGRDEGWL